MFTSISPAPPDAILGLNEAFLADNNPDKINLGVGVYKNDQGQTPILESVRKAEALILEQETTKSYLPISGSQAYATGVQGLLFGEEHPLLSSGQLKTAQCPGGTGGLRVGADFLKFAAADAKVWISKPTWANHRSIFAGAGFELAELPWYDPETRGLNFDGLREALKQVPAGDIVLLHVCCHNPSGVDPSPEQWAEIADLAEAGGWFPFFDFAYQGFGEGLEADRAPLLLFAERGLRFVVAASCSKNFSLYNERVGSFTLLAASADEAETAFSQVKRLIRSNYSNPPRHGAAIVETILNTAELNSLWRSELDEMRNRIHSLRHTLQEALEGRGLGDFSYIGRQKGMFSFSGLSDDQVNALRKEHSIYIVKGGRINVAGIRSETLERLCDAVAAVS